MEDHLKWFGPYANDAKNKRLNFRNVRQVQEMLNADNFFDVAELEEVVKIKEERIVQSQPTKFEDRFSQGPGLQDDSFFNQSVNVSQNLYNTTNTYQNVNYQYQNPPITFSQYNPNANVNAQSNYNQNSDYHFY